MCSDDILLARDIVEMLAIEKGSVFTPTEALKTNLLRPSSVIRWGVSIRLHRRLHYQLS
jgi:hypothetical protein